MKKQIIIFFFSAIHFLAWGQDTKNPIKTSTPCKNEVLFNTAGRWIKGALNDLGSEYIPLNPTQIKEVTHRIESIHKLMFSIYPEPLGIDAVWNPVLGRSSFAEQVKYVRNSQNILNREAIVEKPVASFYYRNGFFRYYCNPNNEFEIWRGYPGETGTWISVYANTLVAANELRPEDAITIRGFPVCMRQPLMSKLGDFELLGTNDPAFSTTGVERYVIVHRKGMSPYIPVTRKEYLDRCIPIVAKWWETTIKSSEEAPVRSLEVQETEKNQTIEKMKKEFASNPSGLKAAIDYYLSDYKTEQQIRDGQVRKLKQDRDDVLKRYQEELEKTTKEGLLNVPAIIPGSVCDPLVENTSIFVDEKEGWMLVIQNPDYMRKELPKYVPQFFVVTWKWNDWQPQADIAKLIEEKFPFARLQAMIDK